MGGSKDLNRGFSSPVPLAFGSLPILPLLQGFRFIDSFFPSGGFAFSSGLEAAVQGGAVRDAAGLQVFVVDSLRGNLGTREAVVVGAVWQAVAEGDFGRVSDLDRQLESMQFSRESRRASRQMGRQVLRIAADQFSGRPHLPAYLASVETGQAPGHLPVALGLTFQAAGWGKREAIAGFLYQTVVSYNSAALKLLPIGQRESQRLLHEWMPLIAEISGEASATSVVLSWTPVQDIYAMRHNTLESRLFRS